jgi:hypothetical protein
VRIRDHPVATYSPWQNGNVEGLIGSIGGRCIELAGATSGTVAAKDLLTGNSPYDIAHRLGFLNMCTPECFAGQASCSNNVQAGNWYRASTSGKPVRPLSPPVSSLASLKPGLPRLGPARDPSRIEAFRGSRCVLKVNTFHGSEAWYKSRLGLITSDEIDLGSPDQVLGAFLRCDRGPIPSDHHTVFLLGTGKPGFNHAAFEVLDFDDLMCGRDFLKQKDPVELAKVRRRYELSGCASENP